MLIQIIKTNNHTIKAKKAFSCIIEPEINDEISIIEIERIFYITNILKREENQNIRIDIKGIINIKSDELKIVSNKLYSKISSIKSYFYDMSLSGISYIIKTINFKTFIKNTHNRQLNVKNEYETNYTYITQHEEIQTKTSRHISTENKIIKAKNIITTAQDQMKLNGKNIHLT